MNTSIIEALLQNTAILLAFSMLYDYLWVGEEHSKRLFEKIVAGFVLGGIGIVIMFSQFALKPGLFFDTRSVMLSISGVFFGLIPTVIAMLITALFRMVEGGDGMWMGIAVVITSGTIGILWGLLRSDWRKKKQVFELLALGVAVHLAMLIDTFLLPVGMRWQTVSNIALPLLTIYPAGNVLLGMLMLKQSKNWTMRHALHESEEKYRAVFEAAGDTIVILQDSKVQFVNHMISRVFGYSRKETINRDFGHFVAPAERIRLKQFNDARMSGRNAPVAYESILLHKNGKEKPVEITVSTLNYNGRPANLLFIRDITERKEAKLRLENERKLLKTLVETIPDLMWLKDLDGHYLSCNNEFERFSGLKESELIGKTDYDLFPLELADFFRQKDANAVEANGAKINLEWVTYAFDGHDALLETIKTPMYDSAGNMIGVLGVAHNVTDFYRTQEALKESERKLKEAQKLAQIGHWELDLDTMLMHFSEALGNILEMEPGVLEMPFDEFMQLIHPDDRKKIQESYASVEMIERFSELTYRLLLPNGRVKHIEQRYVTEYNADGFPIRRHGTIQDITREVLTGIELVKAKEKAEESDRLKSIFLANMSHEIRTPMNAIMGFSNLLSEMEPDDPERDSFIDIIQSSSKRLLQIINDIVDISKIEAGQMRVYKTKCQPARLLQNSCRTFEKSERVVSNSALELKLELPKNYESISIETDALRVQQVIDNLLGNALKFTAKGSVTAGFRLKKTKEGQFVEFYVRDTGVGIHPEKAEIIFERFRQINEDKHREGAGLGLSICKGIVELLGGGIWFTSRPGIETIFSFTIPYQEPHQPQIQKKQVAVSSGEFANLHIIIAEDDGNSFMYLNQILKDKVAEIKHATNGQVLMNLLEEELPDLILLDIDMPVKNGYECLEEIRKKQLTVKIIAQTAYAILEEKEQLLAAGCHGYIAKPVNRLELYQLIADVLENGTATT